MSLMKSKQCENVRYETRCKFVKYGKRFDDADFICDAKELLLNPVYAADEPEEKVHIFKKLSFQTLEEHIPLTLI